MASNKTKSNALVAFAKYPEAGKVKTRLGESIGDDLAASTYRYFVRHILHKHQAQDEKYDTLCAVTPAEKLPAFEREFAGARKYFAQAHSPDLGQRLIHASKLVFENGYKKLAIIGTDSPALAAEFIEQAFQQLEENDLVLGPAKDGGYYLIAMKKSHESLFRGVRWSSDQTLQDTLAIALRNEMTFCLLPQHFDIDEIDGLRFLLQTGERDIFPEKFRLQLYDKLNLTLAI